LLRSTTLVSSSGGGPVSPANLRRAAIAQRDRNVRILRVPVTPRAESAVTERVKGEDAAGVLPAARAAPSNGSMGRTRVGLEVWIANQNVELPEMLTEAARSLADQVDRDPDRSPLWGRYLDCLRQLQEPEQQAVA
jgi:hypothetical protein